MERLLPAEVDPGITAQGDWGSVREGAECSLRNSSRDGVDAACCPGSLESGTPLQGETLLSLAIFSE